MRVSYIVVKFIKDFTNTSVYKKKFHYFLVGYIRLLPITFANPIADYSHVILIILTKKLKSYSYYQVKQ